MCRIVDLQRWNLHRRILPGRPKRYSRLGWTLRQPFLIYFFDSSKDPSLASGNAFSGPPYVRLPPQAQTVSIKKELPINRTHLNHQVTGERQKIQVGSTARSIRKISPSHRSEILLTYNGTRWTFEGAQETLVSTSFAIMATTWNNAAG